MSRSTLSYRPQANGQQERSVKTVMKSVKVYVEDPLQQDWDEIAERLVFAINNSHDMTKKETHSTCVKRKVEGFAYELELPDKSGCRFYPVVHVSRLKDVNVFWDRPKARLAPDVAEEARFDFDEELLSEDSWMPDEVAGKFEVEAILDDRTPMATSTDRPVRELEVKWVGYESTTWEPASNLSCGGLLYDYLQNQKSEQRLEMVQVAEEN
ncbi:hypothetical protein PHMEG_00011226 [Phytophthora megakarya]|uniref:Chromo domain-containing protein n=1 Tax=Phytophthora megakarya TaxID=4795 RepID=A0A225WC25_9STRA|nr:hypothetical protein PHMEG_00011226 [Phytophthora megakarya]